MQGYSNQEPYLLFPNVKDSENERPRARDRETEKERAPEREGEGEREREGYGERDFFFMNHLFPLHLTCFSKTRGISGRKRGVKRRRQIIAWILTGAGHVDIGFYLFPVHLEW